jgi:endonuclease/exonuclease/phosphatase family metal-dependent hydrolase
MSRRRTRGPSSSTRAVRSGATDRGRVVSDRFQRAIVAGVASFALAVAASSGALAAPRATPEPVKPDRAVVDVATYNLYLGADLNPLFTAGSLPDLIGRAGAVYAAMEATDFTERADAIAALIAKERPDVVGLQEVALWETAVGPIGGAPPSDYTVTYDFLELLLDELAARGVHYEEVATNRNFVGTLPISLAGDPALGFPDSRWARFTQNDVIVVRSGLPARHLSVDETSVVEAAYEADLTIPSGLAGVPDYVVPRGWSSVDVTAKGFTFRFFNTHLEAFDWDVRAAQAEELAGRVGDSPHPAVVVGDINSRAPYCTDVNTVAFQTLLDAGLVEAWEVVYPKGKHRCGGFTSGQAADLLNAESLLDHRIDVIMFDPDALTAIRTEVIGDEQRDRSEPSGFWPSDHAGSVATLRTVRP